MIRICASRRRTGAGFTLVELMIVVAVVAILAAIAYPSYMDSVRKSRRSQAKSVLVELAQLAERHYTVNNSYAGFAAKMENAPLLTEAKMYDITISAQAQQFSLAAAPKAGSAQAADKCGVLTLNQVGVRGNAKGVAVGECW